MEIKIGLKVWLKPTGNIRGYRIKEGEVTKIGRKYFYIGDEKFDIKTLKNVNQDCNSAWIIYPSEQAILDEKEKAELLDKFFKLFHWRGDGKKLSLNQLREMARMAELDKLTDEIFEILYKGIKRSV
ncbi:beta barrel domain-containing protein [Alkaliphilus sp. B6464]|uniref:beta barrel domain-containing protein n=1 Tax=Alkaliphilus sp. B6464 TaxID=2731219 RepID=UPI001BA4E820|nr:hypothetical protein [Alkaliphilus sp. B6464]QUH21753.1 hypothetical protein HYG84_17610 [Alkaliphilus sp. B6464]